MVSRAVLVAASEVIKTAGIDADKRLHADVHGSVAGVEGVMLIKFAEIWNRMCKKTTAFYASKSAATLRSLEGAGL